MAGILKKLFGGSKINNEPDLFELNGKQVSWAEYEASPEYAKAMGPQGSVNIAVSGPQGTPLGVAENLRGPKMDTRYGFRKPDSVI